MLILSWPSLPLVAVTAPRPARATCLTFSNDRRRHENSGGMGRPPTGPTSGAVSLRRRQRSQGLPRSRRTEVPRPCGRLGGAVFGHDFSLQCRRGLRRLRRAARRAEPAAGRAGLPFHGDDRSGKVPDPRPALLPDPRRARRLHVSGAVVPGLGGGGGAGGAIQAAGGPAARGDGRRPAAAGVDHSAGHFHAARLLHRRAATSRPRSASSATIPS